MPKPTPEELEVDRLAEYAGNLERENGRLRRHVAELVAEERALSAELLALYRGLDPFRLRREVS